MKKVLLSLGICVTIFGCNNSTPIPEPVRFTYQAQYFKDSITHLCYCGIVSKGSLKIVDGNVHIDKYIPLTNVPCDSLKNVSIILINK